MTVHIINHSSQLHSAMILVAEGDTVIVTNEEALSELISKLADFAVTVALLEGTALRAEDNSAGAAYQVISEEEWVRYTTSDESVISWG